MDHDDCIKKFFTAKPRVASRLRLRNFKSHRRNTSMPRPIVIAHHLVWTSYGWWLPNDPRGSMSSNIATDVISQLGELHFGRKKVQASNNENEETPRHAK